MMRSVFLLAIVATLLIVPSSLECFAQPKPDQPTFEFRSGQSVYVVGMSLTSHNFNRLSADLELERKAYDQFKRQKVFRLSPSLRNADFVFVVILDTESSSFDETAVALLPDDYKNFKESVDELRDHALWRGSDRVKPGLSNVNIFRRKSVAQNLVRRFHAEVELEKGD